MRIVDIQPAQLDKRLAQRRLGLEVSLDAKKWLASRDFDPVYGARPLRRLVQHAIGDQLAKKLLAGEVHDGDIVPVNLSRTGSPWYWADLRDALGLQSVVERGRSGLRYVRWSRSGSRCLRSASWVRRYSIHRHRPPTG